MFVIILKSTAWLVIFLYTMLTIMFIDLAIDEHKYNKRNKLMHEKYNIEPNTGCEDNALLACLFEFLFILYAIFILL